MRVHIRRLSHVPLLALIASLVAVGSARALPGNVLSSQKLSDLAGNFTPILDNGDEFGESMANLGDLDGAGPSVRAMAIGVALDDDGTSGIDRGAVYITFLAANGTVTSTTKISDAVNFPGSPLDDGDWFGSSVAFLGDLDGAGPSVAAIAVGAPGDDDGALNDGAVYILFLSANGTVTSVQKISNTNLPGAPLLSLDEFGSSVADLGDLDGAGPSTRAIAVGAFGDDTGGADQGAVYILFLNASGTVLSTQKISDANLTGSPLDIGDNFGGSVASLGDLDGAGPSVLALAVGAQLDDDGGTDRGAVYVLFLNANGTVSSVQKLSDLAGNFTDTLLDGDEFGTAVAGLGDIDGTAGGVTALAVGVAASDDGGFNRGAVQVLFLNSNGTCNSSRKISGLTGGFAGPLHDEDGFGTSLASVGDLDGAAGASMVTMATGATGDDDGGLDRGAVYMLFLDGIVQRSLTVNVTPAGAGTVAKSPNQASYDNGTSVQLTASPATGWSFSAWSGAVTGSTNPVSVVMDADKTVTATFVDVGSPTVTLTAPNGGQTLVAGTNTNITWTATDNVAVTTVDLELSRNGAAGPYTSIATGIANTGTFSWLVTLPTTS
ncbi:MAG TPA: Ig-like domain-containing protein, partial [Actinomycetota bacterium]|nr:Ig-like domain-containing protein [Actinomycetota bacterium]